MSDSNPGPFIQQVRTGTIHASFVPTGRRNISIRQTGSNSACSDKLENDARRSSSDPSVTEAGTNAVPSCVSVRMSGRSALGGRFVTEPEETESRNCSAEAASAERTLHSA